MTDHSATIAAMRETQRLMELIPNPTDLEITLRLAVATAADLLELHDTTGISLDHWVAARALVEHLSGTTIEPNGC